MADPNPRNGAEQAASAMQDVDADIGPHDVTLERAVGRLRAGRHDASAQLTPMQSVVVPLLVDDNKDVLYLDTTGAGKSEAYFLAVALLRDNDPKAGPVIVFEPTVALAKDQLQRAVNFGFTAAVFPSLPDPNAAGAAALKVKVQSEQDTIIGQINRNQLDMLFITPEMWTSAFSRKYHKLWKVMQFHQDYKPKVTHKWTRVPLVVIDEIHSISDQGRDFRPAYRSVWIALRDYPWFQNARKLGLSATLTPRAQKDVQSVLNISEWQTVTGDFRRANLALRVFSNVYGDRPRINWLWEHIEDPDNKDRNMLVFVPSIERGIAWLEFLRSNGVEGVEFYHSNIADRSGIEERFRTGKTRVLLSTNALGQGWNKSDVHDVIHMWTPSLASQYNQEIGRAGRSADIAARAFLLSSRVWISDGWMVALYRMVHFLLNTPDRQAQINELESSLLHLRLKRSDVEAATKKGQEYKILTVLPGDDAGDDSDLGKVVALVNGINKHSPELAALEAYRKERVKEMKAMEALNDNPKCCWRHLLLAACSQVLPPDWSCNNCSGGDCKPGGDSVPDPLAGSEFCYNAITPNGVPVFSLAAPGEPVSLDVERVKALFIKYMPSVACDPPFWTFVSIPHLANEDAHNKKVDILAEALGLTVHDCVWSDPAKKELRMSGANNALARKVVMDSGKLQLIDAKVPLYGNVVLYDNVMMSGQTMDFVAGKLRERGLQVYGLVDRIYPFTTEDEVKVKREIQELPLFG